MKDIPIHNLVLISEVPMTLLKVVMLILVRLRVVTRYDRSHIFLNRAIFFAVVAVKKSKAFRHFFLFLFFCRKSAKAQYITPNISLMV